MINNLTAKYTKLPSGGYMGQLIEWPEVITEGSDLEDCRASLKDAVEQMVLAYKEQNKEIPAENALFESFSVETV
jgi:predicted RNase H-like HicB family nuclease